MKNVRPKPDIIWSATVDQGKQLELHAEIDGEDHILLYVSADDQDESRWVGMENNGNFVQIPLELIKSSSVKNSQNIEGKGNFPLP